MVRAQWLVCAGLAVALVGAGCGSDDNGVAPDAEVDPDPDADEGDPEPVVQEGTLCLVGEGYCDELEGTSVELRRYDDYVEADVDIGDNEEFEDGRTYTFWWVFINEPDECPAHDEDEYYLCGAEAVDADGGEPMRAGFHYGIPGPDGGFVFNEGEDHSIPTRRYDAGDDAGGPELGGAWEFGLEEGKTYSSEIHIIMRDKGPALEDDDDLEDQISSFACPEEFDDGDPETDCFNHSFTPFLPVDPPNDNGSSVGSR